MLDGFDEIAGGLHRAALAALNATTLPLLVTSRVDEYRAAVESTDVLTSAGAVVLNDLTATDLADYLPRTTRRTAPAARCGNRSWPRYATSPDGDLAAVLTTPLMVGLARTIYSDTPDHDPAELLDIDRFDTREAIERHLLGSFVPTVYRQQPGDRARRGPRRALARLPRPPPRPARHARPRLVAARQPDAGLAADGGERAGARHRRRQSPRRWSSA